MKKASQKTRICLVGSSGKMGASIQALAGLNAPFVTFSLVDQKQELKSPKDVNPADVDVVVEFASPRATAQWAKWCAKHRVPFVTGTTGLSSIEAKAVKAAAKRTAVFTSANMSPTVSVLCQVLGDLSLRLRDFDVEIEEIHHRHKKDKPSGTAKLLMRALEPGFKGRLKAPASLRGGEVFGIHKVFFLGDGETLTIEHQAMGRHIFARGALRAALWICGKKPGMYSMLHMLDDQRGR